MYRALLILRHPAMHNAMASLTFTPMHPAMGSVQILQIQYSAFPSNSFEYPSQHLFKLSRRLSSSLRTRRFSRFPSLFFFHDSIPHFCSSDSHFCEFLFSPHLPFSNVRHQPLLSEAEKSSRELKAKAPIPQPSSKAHFAF